MDTGTGSGHLRRLLPVAVGSAVLAVTAAGCRTSDTSPTPAFERACNDPVAPTEALFRVTASPQEPEVVDVDAGTYSVINTNRGGIEVEVCPDTTLSDIEPAVPLPAAG